MMAKAKRESGLSQAQVDAFEMVATQLERFYSDLQLTSKGKGHDAVNQFKLAVLNNLLTRANALLGEQYKAVPGFSTFDADSLPMASDALLIVSQYLGALEKLRSDNIAQNFGSWYWVIDGATSSVRTAPPSKLARK
jgi:hypothetical protein